MKDHHADEQADDREQQGNPSEAPNPESPEENTAPPSNPEVDPDRLEHEQEDAERTIAT